MNKSESVTYFIRNTGKFHFVIKIISYAIIIITIYNRYII